MGDAILPSVKSFLIADSVFPQASGKWCIIGVFNTITTPRFPALHPALGLFLQLTDVPLGTHEIHMTFLDSGKRQLAVSSTTTIENGNPLGMVEIGMQAGNLLIPAEGIYFIEILFDNQSLNTDIRLKAQKSKGDQE